MEEYKSSRPTKGIGLTGSFLVSSQGRQSIYVGMGCIRDLTEPMLRLYEDFL